MNIHFKKLVVLILFSSIPETSYSIPQRVGICCSRRCSRARGRPGFGRKLNAITHRLFFWVSTLGTELFTELCEALCMPIVIEQICEEDVKNAEIFDLIFVAQPEHELTEATESPRFLIETEEGHPERTVNEYPYCTTCKTFWMNDSCGYLPVKTDQKARDSLRILNLIQKVPIAKHEVDSALSHHSAPKHPAIWDKTVPDDDKEE